MISEIKKKLPATDILNLIEDARNAELCRDVNALQQILRAVWKDNDRLPDFAEYEPPIRAELLRLCGFFLTTYGRSQNMKNYQSHGKDLLTNAVEIFQSEGLLDKAAEANVILAFCYWNNGEISECEAILHSVEMEFEENPFHPVFLQIRINRLMVHYWKQEFEEGIGLIREISEAMSFCGDFRLKTMFHNQAGMIYRKSRQFEESAFHFNEAIRFARKSNNPRFIAANYNNLSLLYRDTKKLEDAYSAIARSIKILTEINDYGFLPHVLDTKALILIDENKFTDALETIEEALSYFYKGEDYNGLTAALWTKVRCLLRLQRAEDAFVLFAELEKTASEFIGEVAVRKFAKKLTEEVYVLRHLPLAEEAAGFRKSRVSKALIESKGVVGVAANNLGLKNHQALSDILNNQFPGLMQELGFKRRAKRGSSGRPSRSSRSGAINPAEVLAEREISRIILPGKNFSFDFNVTSEKFETFYFDRYLMKSFGVKSAAIVAVVPVENLRAGQNIVIFDKDIFTIARAEYNEWSGVYYISDERGDLFPLDESNIVGEAVGYCPFSETNADFIKFSRLEK